MDSCTRVPKYAKIWVRFLLEPKIPWEQTRKTMNNFKKETSNWNETGFYFDKILNLPSHGSVTIRWHWKDRYLRRLPDGSRLRSLRGGSESDDATAVPSLCGGESLGESLLRTLHRVTRKKPTLSSRWPSGKHRKSELENHNLEVR